MRALSQAARSRLQVTRPTRHWPAWITQIKSRRRETEPERLEVIERLAGEARRERRTGASIARVQRSRRWS